MIMSVLINLAYSLIYLSHKTYRSQVIDLRKNEKAKTKSAIFCAWHRYIWIFSFLLRNQNIYALASRSKDGEKISRVLEKFGFKMVRGSSSRGGIKSLRILLKLLQQHQKVLITPDGPRGPACEAKPGAVFLQKKNKCSDLSSRYCGKKKKNIK